MAVFGNQYSVSSRQDPVYSRRKRGVKMGSLRVKTITKNLKPFTAKFAKSAEDWSLVVRCWSIDALFVMMGA